MWQPLDQLHDLARQVQQPTDAVTPLTTCNGDHNVGCTQRSWQQRGRGPPVCWGCREHGHLRRTALTMGSDRNSCMSQMDDVPRGRLVLLTNTFTLN